MDSCPMDSYPMDRCPEDAPNQIITPNDRDDHDDHEHDGYVQSSLCLWALSGPEVGNIQL